MPLTRPSRPPDIASPGVYRGRIISAEHTTSKNGNAMLALKIELLPHHRTVRTWLPLTTNTRWRVKRFCTSCELVPEDPYREINLSASDCLNRFCWVGVVNETWNDRLQAKVDKFLSKEEALTANPDLSSAPLPEQTPAKLRASVAAAPPEQVDELF